MIDMLPKIAMGLGITFVVAVISLGVAGQAQETVTLEDGSHAANASEKVGEAVEDGFGWFPMLILAILGGVALAAFGRYMGWV